ncbi:MAG: dinitrogenase iron-molybdenum cofactor biosynthesis domain-containing protein [Desulfotalea sp.]|nr:MAG: dinitrogenase iron-molybdenum cofactor biosynthesis domain-containing protein [Desulfotalea sp.]
MKIAITVWGNRISPVFDAASTLLVVEVDGKSVVGRDIRQCQPSRYDSFIVLLRDNDVQLLVCGAICETAVKRLEASGVDVAPFLAGEVEPFIDTYLENQDFTEFAMPGCRHGRCCRGRYKRVESQE